MNPTATALIIAFLLTVAALTAVHHMIFWHTPFEPEDVLHHETIILVCTVIAGLLLILSLNCVCLCLGV